jgi:hypothetical protein
MRHHILGFYVIMHKAAIMHGLKSLDHLNTKCNHCFKLKTSFVLNEEPFQVNIIPRHDNEI